MGQALVMKLGTSVAAAGRLVAAGRAGLGMLLVIRGAERGVGLHAVQFCRWPTRLSCDLLADAAADEGLAPCR